MKPRFWLELSCAVVLAAAAGLIVWQARTHVAQSRRLAQIGLENEELHKRAADLERQLAAARAAHAPSPSAPAAAAPQNPADSQYARMALDQVRTIQQLQDKLAQANASISQLETRVLDLQAQAHQLTEDRKRLAAVESELRESLASANRVVDAVQQELKTKNDRIVQIEVGAQKLRQQNSTDSQRLALVSQAITDLTEIHLRQETTLKSILRRYREVTEQYRALSGVLESRRGDPGVISSVDLSRIQSSITMAEEDLRQFSSLTAQAQRIERKISGKAP
jgi:chromosome segregation ATPase